MRAVFFYVLAAGVVYLLIAPVYQGSLRFIVVSGVALLTSALAGIFSERNLTLGGAFAWALHVTAPMIGALLLTCTEGV